MKILVDSGSNLSKEMLIKHNIDYLPFYVTYKDKQYFSSLEWEYYSPEDLITDIRSGYLPEISQPSVGIWVEKIKQYIDDDILYVSISRSLSGGYKTFNIAKNIITSKHRLEAVSLNSAGAGAELSILKLIEKRDQGCSIDELIDYANYLNSKVQFLTISESLRQWSFVGRDSSQKGANYPEGIPLLIANKQTGEIKPVGLYKTFEEALNSFKERVEKPVETCVLSYSYDTYPKWISQIESFVKEDIRCSTYIKSVDCPTITCTGGVNSINVAFL